MHTYAYLGLVSSKNRCLSIRFLSDPLSIWCSHPPEKVINKIIIDCNKDVYLRVCMPNKQSMLSTENRSASYVAMISKCSVMRWLLTVLDYRKCTYQLSTYTVQSTSSLTNVRECLAINSSVFYAKLARSATRARSWLQRSHERISLMIESSNVNLSHTILHNIEILMLSMHVNMGYSTIYILRVCALISS